MGARVGVRWTIGSVADRGFDALRLSIRGAFRMFGAGATYAVCFNSLSRDELSARLGRLPGPVQLIDQRALPPSLAGRVDGAMAQGVAWKLVPLRVFPDRHELALDNDCILWEAPDELWAWSRSPDRLLLGADVRRCYGIFDDFCAPGALNSGLRGLPPGFDLGTALSAILARRGGTLVSEVDEQGLQVAALTAAGEVGVVPLGDVTICSPFPPHLAHLGRCGAHFVGLNARSYGWRYFDRPAEQVRAEHWDGVVAEVECRVGAPDHGLPAQRRPFRAIRNFRSQR